MLSSTPHGTCSQSSPQWIHLTDKKSLSRLLYANPVCFLTCWCEERGADVDDDDEKSAGGEITSCPNPERATPTRRAEAIEGEDGAARSSTTPSSCGSGSHGSGRLRRMKNVMTLSWLTATNNDGCFVFSVNRRRRTASAILGATANGPASASGDEGEVEGPGEELRQRRQRRQRSAGRRFEFALSVPVAGMEDLVLSVGRASGRWGSKFPDDYECDTVEDGARGEKEGGETAADSPGSPAVDKPPEQEEISPARDKEKRSKRKQMAKGMREGCQLQFRRGVPGLRAVPLGHRYQRRSSPPSPGDQSLLSGEGIGLCELFAIDGTVAHLHCRTLAVMEDVVDGDHLLVTAEILCADVHPSYWDGSRRRFFPQRRLQQPKEGETSDTMGQRSSPPPPPYLTFFGSQTLGHMCEGSAINNNEGRNADEASL